MTPGEMLQGGRTCSSIRPCTTSRPGRSLSGRRSRGRLAEPGARRRVQDRTEQVALQRMASSVVADRRKMFELFTILKVGMGACQEDLLIMLLYGSPRYPV